MYAKKEEAAPVAGLESQSTTDPIQNLFATLNRFQRCLGQAYQVSNAEQWCDRCMTELMAGLEIAIVRKWTPVKDALIDTARILHSYNTAGNARDCLPVMNDSYEILSLMVGDLIVDKVRAGVIQKWKDLYKKALAEMDRAGVPLVEDEEPEMPMEGAPSPVTPATTTAPPEAPAGAVTAAQPVSPACDPATPRQEEETPFTLPTLDDARPEENEEEYLDPSDNMIPFPGRSRDMASAAGCSSEPVEAPEKAFQAAGDEEGVEAMTELSEEDSGSDASSEMDGMEEEMELSGEDIATETETGCLPDEPVNRTVAEESKAQEMPRQSSPMQPAIVRNNGNPAPEEDHESLLGRMREAMGRGDVRHAKSAALELAVAMARIEYEQAREAVSASERRLEDNARAIEQAKESVKKAEKDLAHKEEMLAAREGECAASREAVASVEGEMDGLSETLADIDAQIAALQQKRGEQVVLIQAKRQERERAIGEENRLRTEVEALTQEVENMRVFVEDVQADRKQQATERKIIESEIATANEIMESRRVSLMAIEDTLLAGLKAFASSPAGEGK